MDAILSTRRGGLWRPALAAALLGLAGCVGDSASDNDPLFGGPPIPRGQQPRPQGRAAPAAGAETPLPLVGGAPSTTSPAALAVGGQADAEPGPNLRIPGGAAEPAPRGQGGAPLVKLRGPEPEGVTLPAVSVQPRLGGPQNVAANRIDAYQAAQDALAERGVSWQRLETVGDQGVWKFSCSVPSRQNPKISNRYEAEAVGEHGVAAMRVVIQRIDQDQQQP